MALESLGYAALAEDLDQAQACFTQSLALFQQLGDKQQAVSALNNLGCLELVGGAYAQAERLSLPGAGVAALGL
jgi:Flp pilus assembly protein TadD